MSAAPAFIHTFFLLVTESEGSLKIINLMKYPGGSDTF